MRAGRVSRPAPVSPSSDHLSRTTVPTGGPHVRSPQLSLHLKWGEAVSLGREFAGMLPVVSPDGKYLFLGRHQRSYLVDASVIERVRPR